MDVAKYDANMRVGTADAEGMVWHAPDEPPFRLAGFPFFDRDRVYRRMPLHPAEKLPEAVDKLADCTAGGCVHFVTDSPEIRVRTELLGGAKMDHMPATGEAGFDLYRGRPGRMVYAGTTRFQRTDLFYNASLFKTADAKPANYVLNFPLYSGVRKVLVGVKEGSRLMAPPPFKFKGRVVVYGSSITQGGCASRPGMCYTHILSRRLNAEFVNLGFSGSGRGEPEVARVVASIGHPALFVLDYEANCVSTDKYRETLPVFVDVLRKAHPETPLLIVSRIPFARDIWDVKELVERKKRLRFQKELVRGLSRRGDRRVFFLDGSSFLGRNFDECTVDGVHPTDLGFMRMADGMEKTIKRILDSRT